MISSLRITVLMEHRSLREDLLTEYGLSLWIEADEHRILFDTGQSGAFAENAKHLGIDLGQAGVIFLSHGHYDHTGGLETALAAAPDSQVYFHPEAGVPRYSHHPGQPLRSIGMPASAWKALGPRCVEASLTTGTTRITDGIWATGPIPRWREPGHPQSAFSRDEAGLEPDRFTDDQALVIETSEGNIVITGCCHSGVMNALAQAWHITGDARTLALAGGLHLLRSDAEQIKNAMEILRCSSVKIVLSGHCTGESAEAEMEAANLCILRVGSCWVLLPRSSISVPRHRS